ncbi:MAG: 3-dehydro-scyllo-inosose hydrolase [Lachnospiraceae bacterium]|jgi:creatinine amidohydrolase/Fe(II)-dependent formamide hydrolase-like protein
MARKTYKKEVMGETWYMTDYPRIQFEDSSTGLLKKRIWEASVEEIEAILEDYGLPAESELGKAGCYIQNTPRHKVIEKRKKNDVVLIPIGTTENHGIHSPSGLDTYMVTQICEAVRRKTAKMGIEVALALPPINYGGHPYHHVAMPGTYMINEESVRDTIIYVLLGLWDDGYRKFILVNNHGHKWMLESAVQEFFKRYQLPAIVSELEWHRAIREFWIPIDEPDSLTTHFVHADEAETCVANFLFGDMVDMSVCVDAQPKGLTLAKHYDTSVDSYGRPHTWSEGEGHNVIERYGTPEGVVGYPSRGDAFKAKRPIAAICEYITLMITEMLKDFPAGTAPVEGFTTRPVDEVMPCFKEPLSEGWVSVHELPKRGLFYR